MPITISFLLQSSVGSQRPKGRSPSMIHLQMLASTIAWRRVTRFPVPYVVIVCGAE